MARNRFVRDKEEEKKKAPADGGASSSPDPEAYSGVRSGRRGKVVAQEAWDRTQNIAKTRSALEKTKYTVGEKNWDADSKRRYNARLARHAGGLYTEQEKLERKPNKMRVDFGTIKDNEQAVYMAAALYGDSRKKFLEDYAKYSGQNAQTLYEQAEGYAGLFDSPMSTKGQLRKIGLKRLSGEDVDLDTASPDTVVQAIRDIVDDDKHEKAVKLFQSMTRDEDSRFYGYDAYSQDYSFRDSAVLTSDGYKDYVKSLDGKFDPREENLEKSLRVYLAEYEKLERQGAYILSQEGPVLEAAFMQQMGVGGVPDIDELRRMFAEADSAANASAEDDEVTSADRLAAWWANMREKIGNLFSGIPSDSEKAEQEEAEAEGEAPASHASAGGSSGGSSGGQVTPTQEYPVRVAASSSTEVPALSPAENPRTLPGPVFPQAETAAPKYEGRAAFLGGQYEQSATAKPDDPLGVMGAAQQPEAPADSVNMQDDLIGALVGYVFKGKGSQLDEATAADVDAYVRKSPEMRALFGVFDDSEVSTAEARGGNRLHANVATENTGRLGPYAVYAQKFQSMGFIPDAYNESVSMLVNCVDEMSRMTLTAGEQKMVDDGLTTRGVLYAEKHPETLTLLKAAADLDEEEHLRALDAKDKSFQETVAKAKQRLRSGYYTEADWNLATTNTPVRSRADKHTDATYANMEGELQKAFDASGEQAWAAYDVFAEGDTGTEYDWFNTQTLRYLAENGMAQDLTSNEAAHFRCELLSYLNEALSAEDDMAYLMGYENLGEYWKATGTGSVESLQASALARYEADMKAVDEPEAESPYKGDGSVSTGTVLLASGAAGLAGEAAEVWTALSTLGVVTNQETEKFEVRDYYYSTGSIVDAEDRAKADLYSAIEGGYFPDEAVAEKLKSYLDNGGRALDLGIMLSKIGWETSKNANDGKRRYDDFTEWSYKYYTPQQGRLGRFAESATSNLMNAAENFVLSAPVAAVPGMSSVGRFLIGTGASVAAYGPRSFNEGVGIALEGGADLDGAGMMGGTMALAQAWSEMYTDFGIFENIYSAMGLKDMVGSAIEQVGATGARRWANAVWKGLKTTVSESLEEATKDEIWGGIGEGAAQAFTWKTIELTDGLSEMPNPSELLKIAGAALSGGAAAVGGTLKETYENFGANFIGALPLTILSGGAAGYSDWKSTRDIKKAVETGKPEDIEQAGKSIVEDMDDPQKAAAVDKAAMEARVGAIANNILLYDTGEIGRMADAAAVAEEQAVSHLSDYSTQRTRNAAAARTVTELQTAVDMGDNSEPTLSALHEAQEAWSESKNEMEASWREYQAKKTESDKLHVEAHRMARAEASKQVQQERATMTQEAQAKQEARVQEQELANSLEMEAEAWLDAEHKDAPEQERAKLKQRYIERAKQRAAEQAAAGQGDGADLDTAIQQAEAELEAAEQASHFAEGNSVFSASKRAEEAKAKLEQLHQQKAERGVGQSVEQTTPEERDRLMRRDRFARQVGRRNSVRIEFVDRKGDILKGNRSAYSKDKNTIYMPKDATQGDVIVAMFTHELTHRAQESKHYRAMADALLEWKYGDDKTQRDKDRNARKELYRSKYQDTPERAAEFERDGDTIAEQEQVARIAEELLEADEEVLTRLATEKPTAARRIADAIKEVVDRFRGVRDPKLDAMRRAEKYMRKALDEVERNRRREYRRALDENYAKNAPNPKDLQFSPDLHTVRDEQYWQAVLGQDWSLARKVLEEEMAECSIEWPFTAYRKASDALMGFSADGKPQKGYGEHAGYKTRVTVDIRFDGETEPYIDNMDGLNVPHAMERARRNWPGAKEIRFVSGIEENTYVYDADDNLVLPSNRFGWRKNYKEAKPMKNEPSIDLYSEEDYNRFGWARVNDIISAGEKARHDTYLSSPYNNRKTHPDNFNVDGQLIAVIDDDSGLDRCIIVSDGDPESPQIQRIYRFHVANNTQAAKIEEVARNAERGIAGEGDQYLGGWIEDGLVEIHTPENFPRYEDWKGSRETGRSGGRSSENAGRVQDGRRSERQNGRAGSKVLGDLQFAAGEDAGYALPGGDLIDQQIDAWIDRSGRNELPPGNQMAEYSPKPHGDGERQFATQTAQRSEAMPEWLKAELYANPEQRYYLKDTNNDQLMRAWGGIMECGYEQERDRVLQVEHMSADDVATANVIMAMAFRNNDMNTAMLVAHKYNTDGTLTAKALQARKLFSRMTPTALKAKVAGQYEAKTAEYIADHEPAMRGIRKRAKKKEDKIRGLQGGDELLRLTSGESYTIKPNKWNMPLNEQQLELIKQYHLENVPRPGDLYYNRATKKQRMLEAILQTPNPLELTGNGLNLVQRLEMLSDNLAVVTNADLNYIGRNLALYASMDADGQQGREGDLALSRAYEAYGNIDPATLSEKLRTWTYVAMLTSVPSALRNIVGNVTQNTQNAVADGLATTIIDPLVSLFTGNRTRAHLTAKQRAEGWLAAADEAKYTWRDYFGRDKTVVQRGGERFNLNQRGRVYQTQTLENLRLLEGYLMSIGDRPVWKKKFFNSLAEQMNLAEMNGAEFDYDAAVEIAEAEANYSTFNEDNRVAGWLAQGKQIPGFGWVLHFAMPFTGVPTNILKRPVQYSPAGLAVTAVQMGWNACRGRNFDQRAFVDGMARGLTGSMTWALGACLLRAGILHFGTSEDEEDLYYLNTAQGEQYTAFLRVGDQNIGLSTFSPAASAILGGAYFAKEIGEDENLFNAFMNASMESFDTILDASYLTGLTDLLTATTEDDVRGAATSLASSAVSMNIPVALGQVADAFDPFVRDTRDASVLRAAVNTAISKVPILREEMLPAKVDITGEKVKSKPAGSVFWQPLTVTDVRNDETLDELERIWRDVDDSVKIPSYLIPSTGKLTISKTVAKEMYGMDVDAGENKLVLTSEQRVKYNAMYGQKMFGAIADMMSSPEYQYGDDKTKAELLGNLSKTNGAYSNIKREVERQICIDLGYDI